MPGWLRHFLLFSLAITEAVLAQDSLVSAERPAEYMIYQYPGVAMVVRIEAPQTAFYSEIYGADQALIVSSELPAGRHGPLYQYVAAPDTPRQLMIKVAPDHPYPRSQIQLQLIQLSDLDPNSAALAQAYRLLSTGLQTTHSNVSSTWATKSYTLRNAAAVFGQLGWEEMRLWSEFYSAHLVMHRLNDELAALELSRLIQQQADRAGREEIALAARVLESEALLQAAAVARADSRTARYQSALDVLSDVADQAGTQGLNSERARAIYNRGLIYEAQQLPEMAVAQYQQALDIAVQSNDTEMANAIRGTAAEVYEEIGSTAGALGMLEEISGTDTGGDDDELVQGLYDKGRLLNQDYRFTEASAVLGEALAMQRGASGSTLWAATALEQAWALYSLGYAEQSAELLDRVLQRPPRKGLEVQVARAYGSLANSNRKNLDFGLMSAHRDAQREWLQDPSARSEYFLGRATDAWVREGSSTNQVLSDLRQAATSASQAGDSRINERIALYGCLLGSRCTIEQARTHANRLKASGLPLQSAEASWVLSQLMVEAGSLQGAQSELQLLIEIIGFYRDELPGVLGAWYWENRADIASLYLDVMLRRSGVREGGYVDGRAVLDAFEWVRSLGASDRLSTRTAGIESTDQLPERDQLRTEIARLSLKANVSSAAELRTEQGRLLSDWQSRASGSNAPPATKNASRWLGELKRDQVFLSFYFSGRQAYALVANSKQVRLIQLPRGAQITRQLSALTDSLQAGGQDAHGYLKTLGELMIKPLVSQLAGTILLLPAGSMNGIPMDAFVIDGRYLAENYRVINVLSLAALQNGLPRMQRGFADAVFLAGRPQDSQRLFEYDMQVTPEIARLTDRFVGPGLQIVQGVALQKEEFQDDRFASASLVHLATPGTLNLPFPERSTLRLSGTEDNPGRGLIYPSDIRSIPQSASLVTLSGTATRGQSASGFDSRIGLVSDFLDQGANAVLASLWIQPQGTVAGFMDAFYEQLESEPDVLESLVLTRRQQLEASAENDFLTWAGFQLYIR